MLTLNRHKFGDIQGYDWALGLADTCGEEVLLSAPTFDSKMPITVAWLQGEELN